MARLYLMSLAFFICSRGLAENGSNYDCYGYGINNSSVIRCKSKSDPEHKQCELTWTGSYTSKPYTSGDKVAEERELKALENQKGTVTIEGIWTTKESTPRGEAILTKYFPIPSAPQNLFLPIREAIEIEGNLIPQVCDLPLEKYFSRYEVVTQLNRKGLTDYKMEEVYDKGNKLQELYVHAKGRFGLKNSNKRYCDISYENGVMEILRWVKDSDQGPLPPGNVGYSSDVSKDESIDASQAVKRADELMDKYCRSDSDSRNGFKDFWQRYWPK